MTSSLTELGQLAKGQKGLIAGFKATLTQAQRDLERRLLALGMMEGVECEVMHEGWWGKDPIAVRLDTLTLALRREEANLVLVRAVS